MNIHGLTIHGTREVTRLLELATHALEELVTLSEMGDHRNWKDWDVDEYMTVQLRVLYSRYLPREQKITGWDAEAYEQVWQNLLAVFVFTTRVAGCWFDEWRWDPEDNRKWDGKYKSLVHLTSYRPTTAAMSGHLDLQTIPTWDVLDYFSSYQSMVDLLGNGLVPPGEAAPDLMEWKARCSDYLKVLSTTPKAYLEAVKMAHDAREQAWLNEGATHA